jgi:ribosomal protein S18 acetylase RimI-like enzyme
MLYDARRQGRLVGAVWAQPAPGRMAGLHPPQVVPGEPSSTAERLLSALDGPLRDANVRVVQSLLPRVAGPHAERLIKHGFRFTADLLYLVSTSLQPPDSLSASCLEYEPYSRQHRDRLLRLIEASYVDTLDIPSMNGLRSIEDVLEGYANTGIHHPGLWLFVRHDGRDVGCLLLTDHPSFGQCELVYMGLTPAARGRGWGTHLTRRAQWMTRLAGRARLVLAVDAANEPAIATYSRTGFFEWARRSVFLKVFDDSRS